MIHVRRDAISTPEILDGSGLYGLEEQAKAIEFYSIQENLQKKFPYKVYTDIEIKKAFNKLFHNKCAYCESNYAKVQPVDVEHYRPKGGVVINGEFQKPGYYWLGSDWNNLLPSCIDCNRKRTQEIEGQETEMLGKANLFPIMNEQARAVKPGFEFYEKRLLLDPCRDNGEEHLRFYEDGRVEGLSFMGMVSIDTYGLKRKNLVDAREQLAKNIRLDIDRIKWLLGQIEEMDVVNEKKKIEEFFRQLGKEITHLKEYMDSHKEYSALARQMINPYLGSFKERLSK
ncbi:hypothetical protein CN675_21885 [Bacillus toyonensis]|uniref:hypothetical protein n=1 Tax=Bacillus toyonensis TaxID=155322 RepID=UPI000BF025CD|nr:hypothetical protein [Bacillus toyonensis]PEJ14314.1 hypothetical protein CN675_21885 [Bacillus toyonensis]